ncbi:MAG: hypothetical protein SOZ27_07255 [Spirochaetia bacterium]|nr:hypothetical protein [Spirochaetia bacterium]
MKKMFLLFTALFLSPAIFRSCFKNLIFGDTQKNTVYKLIEVVKE